MATTTTNLGLTKPSGTDKIRIAQINGNMDILDDKIGAVGNTSLQAQVTSQNEAISNLKNYTQITGSTKTDIESALVTFSGNMVNGEQRAIWFANGTASAPMEGTTYIGMIGKQENRLIVQVHGISAVYQDLTGFYKSGTGWEWYSLNSDLGAKIDGTTRVTNANDAPTGASSIAGDGTNAPYSFWSTLITEKGSENGYGVQLGIPWDNSTNSISFRQKNSGTWRAWKEVASKSEIAKQTVTISSINVAAGLSDYDYEIRQIGKLVIMNFAFYANTLTQDAWDDLFTLPSGSRPEHNIPIAVFVLGTSHAAGQVYDGRITTNGVVQIFAKGITNINGRAIIQACFCAS